MLNVIGEQRRDYLHILCEKCGEHLECEYLGWDPGVPHFRAKCNNCNEEVTLKLMVGKWKGLPMKVDKS
jgi:hypothetical protein